MKKFDYESKIWGASPVEPSPFYIQGLKLKYTLEDLAGIHGKVLDVGCGSGNMAKAIKKYRPDLEVFGIDISKKAVEIASKSSQGVVFDIAPAGKLPFKPNLFSAVLMFDVLEHLENPSLALKEVIRVLKKDGKFHIFFPLDEEPWTFYWLVRRLGWRAKDKHTGHIDAFSHKRFEELLRKNRFRIVRRRFSFHWFFSLFDLSYFTFLDLFGIKETTSIEGIVERRKSNIFFQVFNVFYRLVVALGFFESLLFSRIPGGGGHYLTTQSLDKLGIGDSVK